MFLTNWIIGSRGWLGTKQLIEGKESGIMPKKKKLGRQHDELCFSWQTYERKWFQCQVWKYSEDLEQWEKQKQHYLS